MPGYFNCDFQNVRFQSEEIQSKSINTKRMITFLKIMPKFSFQMVFQHILKLSNFICSIIKHEIYENLVYVIMLLVYY